MTQPTFVPIAEADQVRPARHLHVPGAWTTSRPAELGAGRPCAAAPASGRRGPTRASRSGWPTASSDELKLGEGESAHDVLLGVGLVASKRAALFGRGPCIYDVRLALNLWGFLDDAARRRPGGAPGSVLLDLPRLRGAAGARRLRPRGDAPAAPRGGPRPGAVPPPRAARATVVDAIGAIDRLEIEAGGFTFTGRACGPHEGRKVLLLHGFPQTSWAWRDELWALGRAGYRAVAPDQRGYCTGARPADVDDYATEHLLDDVIALADSMEMETFDLVGHDWGGMLAWIVASRHPGRVRTLTVVSTPHPLALQEALRGADPRRPPTARPWRPTVPPRCPSACSSAPTAEAGAWPRSWPRPASTTRTPGCTSPP